jgi:ribosomal-protein-alanine N-acetyltransferase
MIIGDYDVVAPWFNNNKNSIWLKSIYRLAKYNPAIHQMSLAQRTNYLCLGMRDNQPVGFVGLSHIDKIDKSAMIWYLKGESIESGRGVATQMICLMVKHAFDVFCLHSINASVAQSNIASCRVLEKNNFQRAGLLRQCHFINGKFEDRIAYDLVAGEHDSLNNLGRYEG